MVLLITHSFSAAPQLSITTISHYWWLSLSFLQKDGKKIRKCHWQNPSGIRQPPALRPISDHGQGRGRIPSGPWLRTSQHVCTTLCCWEFVTVTHWGSVMNNHERGDKWLLAYRDIQRDRISQNIRASERKISGTFLFFVWRQQPARLIKTCLWQVISACIHHLTSSVFLWLSPHLLCLFFCSQNIIPPPSPSYQYSAVEIQFEQLRILLRTLLK